MAVMVIMILLTTAMTTDITDIPIIIITVMSGPDTIGAVMNGGNEVTDEHNPQVLLFLNG
jgi:hypothetical protein